MCNSLEESRLAEPARLELSYFVNDFRLPALEAFSRPTQTGAPPTDAGRFLVGTWCIRSWLIGASRCTPLQHGATLRDPRYVAKRGAIQPATGTQWRVVRSKVRD